MNPADFFDSIENHYHNNLPFVVFKKPNDTVIKAFLQPNSQVNSSELFDEKGFVFSPFTTKKNSSIWFYNKDCKLMETSFIADSFKDSKPELEYKKGKEKHISLVNNAIAQLKANKLQKVIISRIEEYSLETEKPTHWFKKCMNYYTSAFSYCWYHPKIGMWVGASPETLISLQKNKFTTMALAGTMSFSKESPNLEWGKKEKEEQQLVVDSILNELEGVATKVAKGETKTHKAGLLLHLKTEISGTTLKNNNLKPILEALHPTSAVCGISKEESEKYIIENEGYNRKYYTGFLGAFNTEKETDLFVNLRCMEIIDALARIYVGGGITAKSIAEKEWEETVNKTQIMKRILF